MTRSIHEVTLIDLYDKLLELRADVATVQENQRLTEADVKDMKGNVQELTDHANRLKGAFIIVLMLGGALGSIAAKWDKIREFFNL